MTCHPTDLLHLHIVYETTHAHVDQVLKASAHTGFVSATHSSIGETILKRTGQIELAEELRSHESSLRHMMIGS